MKFSRFKNFVSVFMVLLLLVPSFVLVADKKAFAATTPVTWNPNDKGSNVTLSNGNLTMTTTGYVNSGVRATAGVSSGKWYWEIKLGDGCLDSIIGIANSEAPLNNIPMYGAYGNTARAYYGYNGGAKIPSWNGSSYTAYGSTFNTGDVIGVLLDMDNGQLSFNHNGVSKGVAFSDLNLLGSVIYPYLCNGSISTNSTTIVNFGATAFAYPIPDGYKAYNESTSSTEDNDRLYVLLDLAEQAQLSVTSNLSDNTGLTWTSSDPSVATVDANGKVTAVAEGTCKITAAKSDSTFSDYIPIKVAKNAEQLRLALHLNVGESKRLWISDDNTGVTWKSMDSSIAKVDSTGKVTGVAKGLCIIQADLSGKTYYIYARVNS